MNVDLAISLAIFLIFLAILVGYIISTYSRLPSLERIASFREEAIKFMRSLVSAGTPSNWERVNITPKELGISSSIYRIPVKLIETSGHQKVNEPVYLHAIFDPSCERTCWNNTVRVYDSDLNEIPFRIFNQAFCDSQYLKEADLFFEVNISANSSKTYYIFYSNSTEVNGKNYGNFSSLVGWWRFDEGSGNTTKDYSGLENNGTLLDSNTTNADGNTPPTWVDGMYGKALNFDGLDDYVNVSNSISQIFDANKSFTICVWIKPLSDPLTDGHNYTVVGEWQVALSYKIYNSTNSYVGLEGEWNNTGWNGAKYILSASLSSEWHYLCGEYDGDNITLFLNGTKIAELNNTGYNTRLANDIHIGAWLYPEPECFNGTIDEVRIYNRALTAQEINSSYYPPLQVEVYPRSEVSVISSEKLDTLREILYQQLKQSLGTDYEFQIQILPG